MYMLIFCLLAIVSGWTAWRHNPLFSTRATLRFLIAVGGTLAVVIFAFVHAANYSLHAPPARAYTAVFGVTILGTVALIWVIITVSNPPPAALPPTALRVNIYRKRGLPWAKRLVVALLALGVIAIFLPQTGRILVGVFGGILAFLGLICLFAYYLSTRQIDRWLSSVEADPWVHWTYSPEEWKRWTEIEVARTLSTPAFRWRNGWKKVVLYIGGTCAAIMILDPGPWLYRAACCVALCLFMAGLAWIGQRSDNAAPQRLRSILVKAPLEVFFGADGLFADGAFIPWRNVSNYLLAASIDQRVPRSLLLQFAKTVPSGTGNSTIALNQFVLLPEGTDLSADLALLQQQLSATCPSAIVNLS